MAAGARAALREAGRRVPGDVALVGVDDSPVARLMDPPLTSVRQPIEEMGRTMARMLTAEIAGGPEAAGGPETPGGPEVPGGPEGGRAGSRRRVLPTELVVRESS